MGVKDWPKPLAEAGRCWARSSLGRAERVMLSFLARRPRQSSWTGSSLVAQSQLSENMGIAIDIASISMFAYVPSFRDVFGRSPSMALGRRSPGPSRPPPGVLAKLREP